MRFFETRQIRRETCNINLATMMTWMGIRLGWVQDIEAIHGELMGQVLEDDSTEARKTEHLISKTAIIAAGKKELINQEQVAQSETAERCLGVKVRIARAETAPEGVPRLYDGGWGDDFVIETGEVVTGKIDGVSILQNGFVEHGTIQLVEGQSSMRTDRQPSTTSTTFVHHAFARREDGIWIPTVEVELAV